MSDDPATYFLIDEWYSLAMNRAKASFAAGDEADAQRHLGEARAYLNVMSVVAQPTDEQRARYRPGHDGRE